jgi:hypothetical protein
MREDEVAPIVILKEFREVTASLIQIYLKRVTDSPVDSLLAEHDSVVDALVCVIDIRREFRTRNAEPLEKRRIEFCIGSTLGTFWGRGPRDDGIIAAARVENFIGEHIGP